MLSSQINMPTWLPAESRKRRGQRCAEVPSTSYTVMMSAFQKTKDNGIKTLKSAWLNQRLQLFFLRQTAILSKNQMGILLVLLGIAISSSRYRTRTAPPCFVVIEISCSLNTAILASCNNLNAECHPRSKHAVVFHRSLHDSYKKVAIKGNYCRMMQEEDVTCNNIE